LGLVVFVLVELEITDFAKNLSIFQVSGPKELDDDFEAPISVIARFLHYFYIYQLWPMNRSPKCKEFSVKTP